MAEPPTEQHQQRPPRNVAFTTRSYDESEQWIRDTGNENIRRYYRPELHSFDQAIRSVLPSPPHNQLGNIYSHLLAAIIALILECLSFRYEENSIGRCWELHLYRIMALTCFGFSTVYHISNTIRDWKVFLNRLDYCGILAFLASGGCGTISFAFEDYRYLRNRYLLAGFLISLYLLLNILCNKKFHLESFRPQRLGIFLAFGCAIIVPLCHAYNVYSISGFCKGLSLFFVFLFTGLSCYLFQIPERFSFFRGRFDLCPSHTFFHLFVALAAYCYYCKLWSLFDGNSITYFP